MSSQLLFNLQLLDSEKDIHKVFWLKIATQNFLSKIFHALQKDILCTYTWYYLSLAIIKPFILITFFNNILFFHTILFFKHTIIDYILLDGSLIRQAFISDIPSQMRPSPIAKLCGKLFYDEFVV